MKIRDLAFGLFSLVVGRSKALISIPRILRGKWLLGSLPDGNLLFYPLDDFKLHAIISEIYGKKVYDILDNNCIHACDVGAHIGLFTLRISKLNSKCLITALEPDPTNFRFLQRNVDVNGLKERVHTFNLAVGDFGRTATLLVNGFSRGDNIVKTGKSTRAPNSLAVSIITLDKVLHERSNVLKIDVEGMESDVLKGLGRQYKKVDKIAIEVHTLIVDVSEIAKWLRSHGFVIIKNRKLYQNCNLLEASRTHGFINTQPSASREPISRSSK